MYNYHKARLNKKAAYIKIARDLYTKLAQEKYMTRIEFMDHYKDIMPKEDLDLVWAKLKLREYVGYSHGSEILTLNPHAYDIEGYVEEKDSEEYRRNKWQDFWFTFDIYPWSGEELKEILV